MRAGERAARCSSASPLYEKGLFSGPLSSCPGGARRPGRRCDVSVAFERNTEALFPGAGSGRQKSSNLTQIGGFSPRRVCSDSHSCDLKLARASSSCRAAYGQLQEGRRPSTAQAKPNTSRQRTRTSTRACAALRRARAREQGRKPTEERAPRARRVRTRRWAAARQKETPPPCPRSNWSPN